MSGELQIIQGVQSFFSGPSGHAFVVFCARYAIFGFAFLAALTSWRKRQTIMKHAAYEAAWSAILAFLFAMVLGLIFHRIRPFRASSLIELLIPPPGTIYSFPSAHSSVAFSVAFALAYGNPSLGLLSFALAFLVAFGRVGAGVHYPSDVVAGVFVGFLSFAFVRWAHWELRRRDIHIRRRRSKPIDPS